MAHPHHFDAASSALRVAAVAYLALLPSLAACQSEDEADAVETTNQSSPGMGSPTVRDDARPATSATNSGAASVVESQRPAAQNLAPAAPSSPPEPAPAAAGSVANPPAAPAQTFAACTHTEGNYGRNCDSIYVSMQQVSPPRCVQLTIDNCGEYGRQGLGVSVPMPWRVDSGTVGSNLKECELGVFYPSSSVASRASGSITWNGAARLPTEIALDVTLAISSLASDVTNVEVVTPQPLVPTVCN